MHGDQGLDTQVPTQADGLFRGGMGAFQVRGPFVSPNGHQPQVKGAIAAADVLEKRVVASIPAKIDLGVSIADGITGPQGLVSVEQAPGRKVDRRDGGHRDWAGLLGVVPVQFGHIAEAQLGNKLLQLERYDDRDAVLVGQHLQGGYVQVVVVVVGDDQEVDLGQLLNRQSGRSIALWSEWWYRGGVVGQKWIQEDVSTAQTEQKGGVAQPGQPVSGARFEKCLLGRAMTEEVVGRNLGFVPADLAPDVVNPGGQIMFVGRAPRRVAETVDGVMVGPSRQDLGFGRTGLTDVRTATDQSAGQPFGRTYKSDPPGEPDELPPTDRTADDSIILSAEVLFHTPPLALIVAE